MAQTVTDPVAPPPEAPPIDESRGPGLVERVQTRLRDEPALIGLAVIVLVWFVVFERLVWNRHDVFATFDFDLGHHDQAIWLLSRGKGFITVSGMPVLGHHFTVAYFALAPLYWLGGGPQLLIVLQNAALALAAVPIYLLARDRLQNAWWALALAAVWLLNPSVQWLAWETWHPETMAIPFFLGAYLMATRQRWTPYWLLLVAAMAWKEDIAIAVGVLGIVMAIRGQRRIGLLTLGVAIVWFVVAYGLVMPHLNGGTNHAGTFYGELGDSPTAIARTMLTEPDVIIDRLTANDALGYARDLLAPFGFLPLLAPLLLLVALPQFLANVLTNANFFYDIRFHYAAIIVAVLALATVEGIAWLRHTSWRRFAVGFVGACALAASVAWGISPISTQFRTGYWPLDGNARQATLDAAVATVPDDAAVSAPYNIVPHLAHRTQIYTFPNPFIPHNWGVAGVAPDDPDLDHTPDEVEWIIVDRLSIGPESREAKLLATLLEQRGVRGRQRHRRHRRRPAGQAARRRDRPGRALGGVVQARRSAASADSTPLTNRPLLSVEKRLASSTASSMTTATGTSGRSASSNVARRSTLRSSTGMRSNRQSVALAAISVSSRSVCAATPWTSAVVSSSGSTICSSSASIGEIPFACAS